MKKPKPTPQALDKKTAQTVLQADVGNLLRKVQSGQPLTRAQRELIQATAGPTVPRQPDDQQEDRSKPPRSPAELARRLGVSRQRVAAWQNRADAPDVSDVRAWRHYLSQFCRVALKPDDSEAKPAAPGEHNPAPRLHFDDGAFAALDAAAAVLQARLAPEVAGEVFGLIAGKVNKTLLRWGFKEIFTEADLL